MNGTRFTKTNRRLCEFCKEVGYYPPENMPVIAYLTDTLAWAEYCDKQVADYANGGPSAEMLLLVANLMYEEPNEDGKYEKVLLPVDRGGYAYSNDGGKTVSFSMTLTGVGAPFNAETPSNGYGYYTTTLFHSQALMNSSYWACTTSSLSGGKYKFHMLGTTSAYVAYRPIIKLKNSVELVEGENGLLDIRQKQ